MMKITYNITVMLWLCTLYDIFECVSSSVNRGFIFTAPKRFLQGESESGCLSLHNLEPPVHVHLELAASKSNTDDEILASTSAVFKTGVEKCLELHVPSTKYSMGKLRMKMKFDKYPDYIVDTEKDVLIEHDSLVIFLETDKPIYKPGQDVKIRIMVLKHDLKPWKKTIPKVWIENPSEVRVAQWTNVSTENGLAQLSLLLSSEPSPGTWKIKLEISSSQLIHTTSFIVKKYVLPRFQLTVNSPGYILADANNVIWKICAKYSYNKPVKGTLLLKSTPQTPSWRRKQNLPQINYEAKLDSPDGCTDFTVSGDILGLSDWKVAPNNIVLTANFTESGTGVVETVISRTVVLHQSLKLEFIPYTPRYFKLGLPYHGKLRVLYQDDKPAANEKIQVCLRVQGKDEWLRVVVECRNFTSSNEGFVDFIVPPQHKNIVLLSFVATGVDYPTKYYSPDKRWRVFMDQPSSYIDVNPWFSLSESYLAVARGYQPIVCGEKYSFNVMYTAPSNATEEEAISFHYSINSKGDLLIFGHVNHKTHKDSILNYSEFRNLLGATEVTTNKTDQLHTVYRFPLSVKITPSMAPTSELLLYYVRSDGETVATTYTIDVGHCFENKVKTAWHNDIQSPGTTTQFHVEAAPWSLCGISAVDKSTSFLANGKMNLINTNHAFKQLKRFHLNPEARPIQGIWSHCEKEVPELFMETGSSEEIDHLPRPAAEAPPSWNSRRKRTMITYNIGANYVDAMQAFDDFGVIVMSDLILESRPCMQSMPFLGFDFRARKTRLNMVIRDQDETDRAPKSIKAMPLAFPSVNYFAAETSADQLTDQAFTLRSYFPETWLWELVPTGKEGKVTLERTLPHTITDWIGHAVCISSKNGLGIASPTKITAFQPFFLDYSLPYSVKRGEILRLKISLFNYMHHSLPVKIVLEDAPGLDLLLPPREISFCVQSRDNVVHEFLLKPNVLGEINITVSAAIDSEYSALCGPDTLIYTRDAIVKPILVQPEGFPVEVTNSAFICPKNFSDDSSISWSLELPKDLVPGSVRSFVRLTGDILGPALDNLNNLVQLPMGCGEQNMILFVPNLHVIKYLEATGLQNPELRAKAIKNMQRGYQRELNYRHTDGSYSAFGPDNSESGGSMWLTSFVVKSFAQARSLIHIDERDLKLSVKWIVRRQLENGCFPVLGKVFHKDMKGGLRQEDSSSSALTAYILISLLESSVPLSVSLVNNALYCLEKSINSSDNLYTAALTTYALALLEHPKANSSLQNLLGQATRYNDLLWLEDKTRTSLGLNVEMTAYLVLSLVKLGGDNNMVEALRAVRWMTKHRNAEGGFVSTQDTALGLEALTKYATVIFKHFTDLSILIIASEIDHVFKMDESNRMVLTQIALPVLPTTVEIFAEGEGCVFVQSSLKYNKAKSNGSEAFDLSATAESIASVDECSMQKLSVCVRYKMADEESNMALLEIGMISGYVADQASLHALLEDLSLGVKRFEEERDNLVIYFDKLTSQKTCISILVNRENVVDRPEPANIKLYDYYQQELTVFTNYRFAPTCSSAGINEQEQNPLSGDPKLIEHLPNKENQHATKLDARISKQNQSVETSSKVSQNEEISAKNQLIQKSVNMPEPSESVSGLIDEVHKITLTKLKDDKETGKRQEIINVTHVHKESQEDIGSGLAPDEVDFSQERIAPIVEGFFTTPSIAKDDTFLKENPFFTVIDHELDTPEGVEGPPPIYVEAPNTFFTYTESPEVNEPISTSTQSHPETNVNASCPHCEDSFPDNLQAISCSANNIVKVAIRRFRKARFLLDLSSHDKPKRLRGAVEFILPSECVCTPLDKAGRMALLFNKAGSDFTKLADRAKHILDNSTSVYTLPTERSIQVKVIEARSFCLKQILHSSSSPDTVN